MFVRKSVRQYWPRYTNEAAWLQLFTKLNAAPSRDSNVYDGYTLYRRGWDVAKGWNVLCIRWVKSSIVQTEYQRCSFITQESGSIFLFKLVIFHVVYIIKQRWYSLSCLLIKRVYSTWFIKCMRDTGLIAFFGSGNIKPTRVESGITRTGSSLG